MNAARPADILRRLERADGAPEADAELLARFAATRDAAAFAELVRRHGPLVLGVCRRVTGHPQDAEDAFQATFLVLAKKAGSLRNPALVGNWLYGVAYRVAWRAKRSAARRRAREVPVFTLPEPHAPPPATAIPELTPILDEELAALPACYRDAIVLCDLRGASREEAAAALGIPEGTLSSRLANGRKKLAARLTKRGVALSTAALPAALASAQAAVAVPNELVTTTCGLVADLSAGGAVPGPLAKLAEGGLTVRKTFMLVAVMGFAVGGAVLAARSDEDAPPVDPPKPPLLAQKPDPAPQPKEEAKPGDKAVAYTSAPRMRVATDVAIGNASAAAWSADGKFFALQGTVFALQGTVPKIDKPSTGITMLRIHDGNVSRLGTFWAGVVGDLVGFTPDSRGLITVRREYHLVSGFHWLRYEGLEIGPPMPPGPPEKAEKVVKEEDRPIRGKVDLDLPETHGYAFAPDGKTFRTVALHREATGTVTKLEVLEVDAATGKAAKSLLKTDFGQHALSANGKRLAVLDKESTKVTVSDLDRGAKLSEHKFAPVKPVEVLSQPGFDRSGGRGHVTGTALVFSPDGSRLAVSRGISDTHLLNAETGEALPALEGVRDARILPSSFTGDGRLLAAAGTRYERTTVKGAANLKGGGREQTVYRSVGSFLTVWDTQTGKALKTWDKSPGVLFHPTKPLMATLESHGENQTRVGFWDFSAEVGKK